MDSPKNLDDVPNEPSFSHQPLAHDDHSKLIKAKETPIRQNNESNNTTDRSSALVHRPPQSVQSHGSRAKLITLREHRESFKKTVPPITDGPEEASVQSTATRECAATNRLDDVLDCRVSIRPSIDYVATSDQSAQLHAAVSNQSAESVVCRICHLSATESS